MSWFQSLSISPDVYSFLSYSMSGQFSNGVPDGSGYEAVNQVAVSLWGISWPEVVNLNWLLEFMPKTSEPTFSS